MLQWKCSLLGGATLDGGSVVASVAERPVGLGPEAVLMSNPAMEARLRGSFCTGGISWPGVPGNAFA